MKRAVKDGSQYSLYTNWPWVYRSNLCTRLWASPDVAPFCSARKYHNRLLGTSQNHHPSYDFTAQLRLPAYRPLWTRLKWSRHSVQQYAINVRLCHKKEPVVKIVVEIVEAKQNCEKTTILYWSNVLWHSPVQGTFSRVQITTLTTDSHVSHSWDLCSTSMLFQSV